MDRVIVGRGSLGLFDCEAMAARLSLLRFGGSRGSLCYGDAGAKPSPREASSSVVPTRVPPSVPWTLMSCLVRPIRRLNTSISNTTRVERA